MKASVSGMEYAVAIQILRNASIVMNQALLDNLPKTQPTMTYTKLVHILSKFGFGNNPEFPLVAAYSEQKYAIVIIIIMSLQGQYLALQGMSRPYVLQNNFQQCTVSKNVTF